MEHGPLWLQEGEYQRGQGSHEELRNDDEDVVYTLAAYAYMQEEKDVGVSYSKGGNFLGQRTNQDDPCFRVQTSSAGTACPVLYHVLSEVREIYPAATGV